MLILDTDREKLKRIYNILKTKISDLKINVNKKVIYLNVVQVLILLDLDIKLLIIN